MDLRIKLPASDLQILKNYRTGAQAVNTCKYAIWQIPVGVSDIEKPTG